MMARVDLEAHRDKSAPAAQIDSDIDALAGVQEHALELAGRREKAAVRAEQVEGNQGFTVAESKQQAARAARIQELEPHPAGANDPACIELAVDERAVAEPAVQAVLDARCVGAYRAADDPSLRDGECEPISWCKGERRIERVVILVGHYQQAGESGVDLLGGEAVGMGMEPVQPGAVLHFEAHPLARAWLNRIETRAVGRFRQRQPGEVHGGGLRQRVLDDAIEALAAARPEDRLRDSPRPEVCHVSATPGDGGGTFHAQTSHYRSRNPRRPYGIFIPRHDAAGPP